MIYLIQAYRHPDPAIVSRRYNIALDLIAKAVRYGVPLFSPILNSHQINLYHMDIFPEDVIKYDLQILAKCDLAWAIQDEGLGISKGCQKEIKFCNNNIPVKILTVKEIYKEIERLEVLS